MFRDLEQQAVAALCQRTEHVLSLGGGAILREENRAEIGRAGTVIWLTASPTTIHQRLEADATTSARRPNLTTQGGLEEIESVLAKRRELYQACADLEIDTEGKTLDEVVQEILPQLA